LRWRTLSHVSHTTPAPGELDARRGVQCRVDGMVRTVRTPHAPSRRHLLRKPRFWRCECAFRASRSPVYLGCWGVAQVVRRARRGWNGTVPGREERRKCPTVPATWRGCVCNVAATCNSPYVGPGFASAAVSRDRQINHETNPRHSMVGAARLGRTLGCLELRETRMGVLSGFLSCNTGAAWGWDGSFRARTATTVGGDHNAC